MLQYKLLKKFTGCLVIGCNTLVPFKEDAPFFRSYFYPLTKCALCTCPWRMVLILCIPRGNDQSLSPSYDSFDDGDGSVVEELTSGDDDNGAGGGMMEATGLLFQSFSLTPRVE